MVERKATSGTHMLARGDSGMALMTVMFVTVILFMLLGSLLTFSAYYSTQTHSMVKRTQSVQLADAGLNQYLLQLSQNYSYWKTNPTLGPTAMAGGSWTVTAAAPTSTSLLTLRSTATLSDGTSRTVTATVRFPTFSDYSVFVDLEEGTYSIGNGATFYGAVRSNGNISNSGVITGMARAGGTCSAGRSFGVNYPGGHEDGAQIINFSALTTDLNELKATAIQEGSYYPASGAVGYQATISGKYVVIGKITAINRNYPRYGTDPQLGSLTVTPLATLPVPSAGVLYFDDDVWVRGTYDVGVTLATSKDAYVTGDVLPASTNTTHSCGIVASEAVLFPYWMQAMPAAHKVQAAMLAEAGGVGPDNTGADACLKYSNGQWKRYDPPLKDSVTITGSRAMAREIGFSSGYTTRNFLLDPRLNSSPPPSYPEVPGDSLKVETWWEN